MAASKGFFVVRDVEKIEGKRRFAGDLIIKGRVDEPDDPGGGSPGGPNFDIPELPKLFELKWILPPESNPHYRVVKHYVQLVGYETVEHDDFSYPPRG